MRDEEQIAEFLAKRGATKCPTRYASPSQAYQIDTFVVPDRPIKHLRRSGVGNRYCRSRKKFRFWEKREVDIPNVV